MNFKELEEKICNSTLEDIYDDDSAFNELNEILLNSREQNELTEQLIKNQIEVKDRLIDKLHSELDFYKQDSADRFVDQVMKSLIKVRRDMLRTISSGDYQEMTADELRKEYTYIFEDMTDLLEQQNIDAYSTSEGEIFDPSIHVAKVEITDDINLDKKIKMSINEGFKKNNKVLIPEKVIVYQYRG